VQGDVAPVDLTAAATALTSAFHVVALALGTVAIVGAVLTSFALGNPSDR